MTYYSNLLSNTELVVYAKKNNAKDVLEYFYLSIFLILKPC